MGYSYNKRQNYLIITEKTYENYLNMTIINSNIIFESYNIGNIEITLPNLEIINGSLEIKRLICGNFITLILPKLIKIEDCLVLEKLTLLEANELKEIGGNMELGYKHVAFYPTQTITLPKLERINRVLQINNGASLTAKNVNFIKGFICYYSNSYLFCSENTIIDVYNKKDYDNIITLKKIKTFNDKYFNKKL